VQKQRRNGDKVKRIKYMLYLGTALLGLFLPLQVKAAGQDAVVLTQNEDKVAVSLEMSNAAEEKITAVSVSLKVNMEGQAAVGFSFAPELENTEHGFIYKEEAGRLDIYVASAESIFQEETLNLGYVQINPADMSQPMSAAIGYCDNSFRAANGSYGEKIPMVENAPEPISIQVGSSAIGPSVPEEDGNEGNGDGGNGGNGGQGSGSGGNINDGLYDQNTQFKNDPSSAVDIPSQVILKDQTLPELVDLSKNKAAGGKGKVKAKTKGKTTVIDPKDGPSSILIAKDGEEGLEEGGAGAGIAGTEGENLEEGMENGMEEIVLDKENGGAEKDNKKKIGNKIFVIGGAIVGVAAVGACIFIFIIKGGEDEEKRRKKKKKRKKKTSGKRKPRK